MAYNNELAREIVHIVRSNTNIRDIKEKLDIVQTICKVLGESNTLYAMTQLILRQSGLVEHFVYWCIDHDIVVLDSNDFIDFLKTEKFNSTEKSLLPLINPRVNYFPEVFTSTAQNDLNAIERKISKRNK